MIHAPSKEKLFCANLDGSVVPVSVASGQLLLTQTGLARGYKLQGKGFMARMASGNTALVFIGGGFDPEKGQFPAHVHNLSCAAGGGGHYKIEADVAQVIPGNEMWLELNGGNAGFVRSIQLHRDHLARPEAQSIIIHDPEDKARIACMDLVTQP